MDARAIGTIRLFLNETDANAARCVSEKVRDLLLGPCVARIQCHNKMTN